MACRFIKSSWFLLSTVRKIPIKHPVISSSFVLCRDFNIGQTFQKRRKTAEERVSLIRMQSYSFIITSFNCRKQIKS